MTDGDLLRIARDHLDVVLIFTCAWGLAAWLVFSHLNERMVDEHDELGVVNVEDKLRKRDMKASEEQHRLNGI